MKINNIINYHWYSSFKKLSYDASHQNYLLCLFSQKKLCESITKWCKRVIMINISLCHQNPTRQYPIKTGVWMNLNSLGSFFLRSPTLAVEFYSCRFNEKRPFWWNCARGMKNGLGNQPHDIHRVQVLISEIAPTCTVASITARLSVFRSQWLIWCTRANKQRILIDFDLRANKTSRRVLIDEFIIHPRALVSHALIKSACHVSP